jgi:hypothetical protein
MCFVTVANSILTIWSCNFANIAFFGDSDLMRGNAAPTEVGKWLFREAASLQFHSWRFLQAAAARPSALPALGRSL